MSLRSATLRSRLLNGMVFILVKFDERGRLTERGEIGSVYRCASSATSCVFFWVGFMSMDEQDMEHQRVFPAIVLWVRRVP